MLAQVLGSTRIPCCGRILLIVAPQTLLLRMKLPVTDMNWLPTGLMDTPSPLLEIVLPLTRAAGLVGPPPLMSRVNSIPTSSPP